MITNNKMLSQIIEAMNALGGHCYYKDLYAKIAELHPDCYENYSKIGNWKASIRANIERFSSDSKSFQGKNDVFYSIDGLGKGHWGLRTPDITEQTMDYSADDEGFLEGKMAYKKHLVRERNHALKVQTIKKFKATHGNNIYCEICGFDFYKTYGDIGKDFIEVHHTIPISTIKENEKTKVEDMALLCSNCHSMIHRRRPWLKKEDIKKLIQ